MTIIFILTITAFVLPGIYSTDLPPAFSNGKHQYKQVGEKDDTLPEYSARKEPLPEKLEKDFFAKLLESRANKTSPNPDPHEIYLTVGVIGLAHPKLVGKWYKNWDDCHKDQSKTGIGLDIGDIIEQQVTKEQGKKEYHLYIYVGDHTAVTVENEQQKVMNESPKNVPTRINNHLKSVYPSFPLDIIKDRAMSQEPGKNLRGATSEEFVNFIVFSQLVSPMKDRQNTPDETHVLDLQMFLYQLGSDGLKVAKDRERYVNIINGGSDSLATDSVTFIKDTQVIGIKNIQTPRAPIIPMRKPRGNGNNATVVGPEYFFSQINVRDNDKLWIIVSFKHDMPTLTYFLYLTKENLQKIKENTLVLRTNPQLQYRVDWVPKSTDVNNESNGFWVKIREITEQQLKMENIVPTVTRESKNSTAKL